MRKPRWFLGGRRSRNEWLEFSFVVVIIAFGTAIFLSSGRVAAFKVRQVEALSLSWAPRTEAIVARASDGRDTVRIGMDWQAGKYFEPDDWRDGELVMRVRNPGRLVRHYVSSEIAEPLTLGFRFAVAPNSGAAVWLCGTREPPPGFVAAPPLHTNLVPELSVHACRARRAGEP
jgi:hypothetical protein